MPGFKRKSPADLQAKLEKMGNKREFGNANEWKLKTDNNGNGSALIRFLPAKSEDGLPFVKVHSHGFKENGKWFIENCPSTIDQPCPVCEANGDLWNAMPESDQKDKDSQHPNKKIVRNRKRSLSYWANIVVLKDDANPDNVGKVFMYRFGKKILDKITAKAQSNEDLGVEGIDVTCVFEGANFQLNAKRASGFPNYDDSVFGVASELFDGDEDKLQEVYDSMHDLDKLVAPSAFKSEAEIRQKLAGVIGGAARPTNAAADLEAQLDAPASKPVESKPVQSQAADEPAKADDASLDTSSIDDDLDSLLAELED